MEVGLPMKCGRCGNVSQASVPGLFQCPEPECGGTRSKSLQGLRVFLQFVAKQTGMADHSAPRGWGPLAEQALHDIERQHKVTRDCNSGRGARKMTS